MYEHFQGQLKSGEIYEMLRQLNDQAAENPWYRLIDTPFEEKPELKKGAYRKKGQKIDADLGDKKFQVTDSTCVQYVFLVKEVKYKIILYMQVNVNGTIDGYTELVSLSNAIETNF